MSNSTCMSRYSSNSLLSGVAVRLFLASLASNLWWLDLKSYSAPGLRPVSVEQWNIPQALTLLEVMQNLMDMNLLVLKASDSSSTEVLKQNFEVTDSKGKKIVNDKFIANITKTLSLRVLDESHETDESHKMEWMSESLETSIDRYRIVQMHVIEVVAERSAGLLGDLSRLLVATKFRVQSAECWTREGRVKCVMYVVGARMGTLLGEVRHNMECFPISTGLFKISVHRIAAEEFSHLNRRLHNLKSMDLTRPRSSSNIYVHQRKDSKEGFPSAEVVLCFEFNRRSLFITLHILRRTGYKIVGASAEYPGPYEVLKGRATKIEDIDVDGKDELEKISIIERVAIERRCPDVELQLMVSGPSKEMHDDLIRGLCEDGLIVTGGQVYREFGTRRVLFFLDSSSFFPLKTRKWELANTVLCRLFGRRLPHYY